MSSSFGSQVEMTIFGESHGPAIGVVLNNLPAGEPISEEGIAEQLARRAPGQDPTSTARKEPDVCRILSGMKNGVTTGAPLCAVIQNTDTRSGDYANIALCPRPSHADYAAHLRYKGCNDISGSGHFSGRLTAPLVIAGSICRQILLRRGVHIGGHVLQIGGVQDEALDPVSVSAEQLDALAKTYFSTLSPHANRRMRSEIEAARMDMDSVGGLVELAAVGLPAGVGSPMFGGVENILAGALYGVPAVKGVAFGAGFAFGAMRGSAANDCYRIDEADNVRTETNNCGGITGGITTGMPLMVQVALKPTPSIGKPQDTVNLETMENTVLQIKGRHDPCIVPRALPALEAALAVGLMQLMAEGGKL